jgi:Dyp-type peroxidase family
MTLIDRADIQGNILDGYNYDHVQHVFARFVPGRARHALDHLLPELTLATRWQARSPDAAINLGLSHLGLQALGLDKAWLRSFPEAYRSGMLARAEALGDDVSDYDEEWHSPVHLWLWIQARDRRALKDKLDTLLNRLEGDLEHAFFQDGTRLRNLRNQPIEHFGFRDGISQPDIAGSLKAARPGDGTPAEHGQWRPVATGEFLLGHVDETGAVATASSPPALSANATFAVFRKLEQDVRKFQTYLHDQAQKLQVQNWQWLAERMVGRRLDGSALVQAQGTPEEQLNDFTFTRDEEGRGCPLGSHIRRANPRGSEGFRDSFARHRIVRRSVTYGEPFDAERANDQGQRGIFFVALNADIERQFEFLQRLYMNDGAAPRQGHDTDPVAGPHSAHFVIPGDAQKQQKTLICTQVPSFVKCRGGEYFMLPGRSGLELMLRTAHETPRKAPHSTLPGAPLEAEETAQPSEATS